MAKGVLWGLAILLMGVVPAAASIVANLPASRDTTIFQDQSVNSDGGDSEFFVGQTGQGLGHARRVPIAFGLTSIPPGSTIVSVDLTLTLTGSPGGPSCPAPPSTVLVNLHPLSDDWGEGTQTGGGGGGGAAATGDATWTFRFFNTVSWGTAGGDFAVASSAAQAVGLTNSATFTWGSTAGMVADVQGWVNNAATNFGWILIGDETQICTARAFASREDAEGQTPVLTVTYNPPPIPALSTTALLGLMALLALGGAFLVARRPGRSG